jgi:hypothetical protein
LATAGRAICIDCWIGSGCAGAEHGYSSRILLGEEEISDVSLSTFYVFDKENDATPRVAESP